MTDTIRVCIGTEPKTALPCKILMYSISRNVSTPITFHIMEGFHWEKRSELKCGEGTGFSLRRWDIPSYFDYEGYAIYLDADQLVLGDIRELWNYKHVMGNACLACTYQVDKGYNYPVPNTSVMLMNNELCKKVEGWIDTNELREYLKHDAKRQMYSKIMHALHLEEMPYELPKCWNNLNEFSHKTKLLHYTKEPEQPWYKPTHKLAYLWKKYLKDALDDGIVTAQELRNCVAQYKPHTSHCRGQGLHPQWLSLMEIN